MQCHGWFVCVCVGGYTTGIRSEQSAWDQVFYNEAIGGLAN